MHNEQILIQRLLDGEKSAFNQVVTDYHNVMLSVARAIVGEAFADEVVQEAWMSALKALSKFEGRSSLKTWLLHIVSNGAKSRLRRESRHSSLDEGWQNGGSDRFDNNGHWSAPPLPWHTDSPEALLASDQLRNVIEECFQKLPAPQRAALTMYDMEGIEMEEICNILNISNFTYIVC